jgi:predicted  nucleic acid-binding Zn-ribbon protein
MIAEISSNAQANGGLWIAAGIAALGGVPGVIAVFSLFATRREVQSLESKVKADAEANIKRLEKTEKALDDLQRELHMMENRITEAGEKRAIAIHERTNEILSALSELRGRFEATTHHRR